MKKNNGYYPRRGGTRINRILGFGNTDQRSVQEVSF